MKKIAATLLILIAVAVVVVSLVTGILFMRTSGDYTVAKTLAQDKTITHIEIKGDPFHSENYGTRYGGRGTGRSLKSKAASRRDAETAEKA